MKTGEKVTKLRVKRLPQDEEWLPPTGIKLLKDNFPVGPVPVADFRIENLHLSKVAENLTKYFKRMPTHVRVIVDHSWH